GTYVQTVGRHLAQMGCDVHVFHFSALPSDGPQESTTVDGQMPVYSCTGVTDPLAVVKRLRETIESVARERGPFDFIQCPEFGAYGLALERGPRVRNWGVHLHTSTKIARLYSKTWHESMEPLDKLEEKACLRAPVLTAPSRGIVRRTASNWPIDVARVRYVPNPRAHASVTV